jgi:alpha-beta hydrolase superfamily lysophospholipase
MHILWKAVIYGAAGYLILCLLIFLFQRKLLYFPDQTQLSVEAAKQLQVRHWPSHDNFRGFISTAKMTDAVATIIIFHGNAGTAYHRLFYTLALSRLNMRVLLAEYPGYGGREGQPSQKSFTEDAIKTIQQAYLQFGDPIFLWGESLGSAVISSVVQKTDVPIQGVVLLLPWDRLVKLAQKHYWYLPVPLLLKDKYDNVENLKGYDGRVAVLIAENDEIVPANHGKTLYKAISSPKKIWVFNNASHNNFPIAPENRWWKEVVAFLTHQEPVKE